MTSRRPTSPINNPIYSLVNDEAVTNLVVNPSFEVDTTGWAASGANASIARITSEKVQGDACLQIDVTPAALNQGAITSSMAVSGATVYVVSLWLKSPAGAEFFNILMTGNNSGATSVTHLSTTSWRRYTLVKTTSAGDTTATITIRTNSSIAATWYVDCVQLEASTDPSDSLPTPTAYCDGSMGVGHAWTGTAHNSTSTRAAGEHHLASIVAGSQNSVVVKTDGTQVGFRKKHRFESTAGALSSETGSMYLWGLEAEKPTIARLGSNESLAFINNKSDGVGLWVKSSAAADFTFMVEAPSITTGAIVGVIAPSDLSSFTGHFLRFFDKSNTDTFQVKRDTFQYGNLALGWDKKVNWYSGGKYTYTSGSNLTGTVSVASTAVTGVGTLFTSEVLVGDILTFTGSATRGVVEAIASDTALTLVAAGPSVSGVTYQKLATRYGIVKTFVEGPNGDHIGIAKADVTNCLFITGSDTYKILPTSFTAGTGTLQIVSGSGTVTLGTANATIAVGDWIHIPGQTSLANGHPPLQVIRKASNTSLRVRPAASASFTTASGAWFYQRANQLTEPTADSQGVGLVSNLAQDATAAGPSASSSEVSIFSSGAAPYVRASTLSTNRMIRVSAYGTLSGANAGKTLTLRVKLGVTTILTTHAEVIADVSTQNWKLEVLVAANAAENAQKTSLWFHCQSPTTSVADQIIDYETASVSTDADQQLDITAQWGVAASTLTAEYKLMEIV